MNIFPLDHLHYESFHPEKNDGPDIVDMVDYLRLARKEIDAAILQCRDTTEQKRLIDDNRRFIYGEDMIYFYNHLVRTALLHRSGNKPLAKQEFIRVDEFAEKLRNISDLVAPMPGHSGGDANASDGLDASQAVDVYEYFKKFYGN